MSMSYNKENMSQDEITKHKTELIKVLNEILKELPRPTTEKDIKKAYHKIAKRNIQIVLDEVVPESPILYNFLRHHCQEICTVITNDGEVRIYRNTINDVEEKKNKKKKANPAPKLNYPRVPLAVSWKKTTGNPQWTGKTKELKAATIAGLGPDCPDVRPDEEIADYIYDRNKNKKTSLFDFASQEDGDDEDDGVWEEFTDTFDPVQIEDPEMFPKLTVDDNQNEIEASSGWLSQEALMKVREPTPEPARVEESPKVRTGAIPKRRDLSSSTRSSSSDDQRDVQRKVAVQRVPARATEPKPAAPVVVFDQAMFLDHFYPKIIVDPKCEIPQRTLKEGDCHRIKVTVYYSKDQFLFEDICPSMSFFMRRFTNFYDQAGQDLRIRDERYFAMKTLVAVKAGNWWLRARVVVEQGDAVICHMADLGVMYRVPKGSVAFLCEMFAGHPLNVFRGSCIKSARLGNLNKNERFEDVAANNQTVRVHHQEKETGAYQLVKLTAN